MISMRLMDPQKHIGSGQNWASPTDLQHELAGAGAEMADQARFGGYRPNRGDD